MVALMDGLRRKSYKLPDELIGKARAYAAMAQPRMTVGDVIREALDEYFAARNVAFPKPIVRHAHPSE
jgi:hypothetical protein